MPSDDSTLCAAGTTDEAAEPASNGQPPTARERAIEVEVRLALHIMWQCGVFNLAAAQYVAAEAQVSKRSVERWRKDEAYLTAIMAGCTSRRIDVRKQERQRQFFVRQRRAALTGRWNGENL